MTDTIKTYIEHLLYSWGWSTTYVSITCFFVLAAIIACLCLLCGYICEHYILPIVRFAVKKTKTKVDDLLLSHEMLHVFCHLLPGILFYHALTELLADPTLGKQPLYYTLLYHLTQIYIVIYCALLISQFLTSVEALASGTERWKNYHLKGIFQAIKLVVFAFCSIIVVALFFGRDPFNVLAGLGAAAAILTLAFKDIILGFVASIQLTTNRMLKRKDWVIIDKLGINGTVEEVNLTTVKIRNFDNSVSTVPPYTLVSDSFQNWGEMHDCGSRRVKRAVYIDITSVKATTEEMRELLFGNGFITEEEKAQTDAINLTLFRHYVERLIRLHPKVNAKPFLLVRQLEPTPYGLPIEIWFYFSETDFEIFENLAAEFMERVYSVTGHFGLRFFQKPTGYDCQGLTKRS